jgi:hypothetical protein
MYLLIDAFGVAILIYAGMCTCLPASELVDLLIDVDPIAGFGIEYVMRVYVLLTYVHTVSHTLHVFCSELRPIYPSIYLLTERNQTHKHEINVHRWHPPLQLAQSSPIWNTRAASTRSSVMGMKWSSKLSIPFCL